MKYHFSIGKAENKDLLAVEYVKEKLGHTFMKRGL